MTYLVDTNVLSELRKEASGRADRRVIDWLRGVGATMLFLSAITIYELEIGVLPIERRDARQGAQLRKWVDRVAVEFAGRILPVDAAVAAQAAQLNIPDPMDLGDAMIAATAMVHRLTVVTRNTRDFARTGINILDPWRA